MVVKSSRLTPLRQCSLPFRIQIHRKMRYTFLHHGMRVEVCTHSTRVATLSPLSAGRRRPRTPLAALLASIESGSVLVGCSYILSSPVLFASDDRQAKGQRRCTYVVGDDADTGLCHRQTPKNRNLIIAYYTNSPQWQPQPAPLLGRSFIIVFTASTS